MAPREWNAYVTLNITSRDSDSMTCVGNTRYGNRCRWGIEGRSYRKIRGILDAMEEQPPNKAVKSLEKLAYLSLCEEYHQNQADNMVENWKSAVFEAGKEYEEGMGLRKKNQALQKKLVQEEAKTEELEEKIQDLQARIGNKKELREQAAKIDRLEAQLVNERTNLTSATTRLKIALKTKEEQEDKAERYRRSLLKSKNDLVNLEGEKTDLSHKLALQKEELNTATRVSDDKFIEYERSLSQKDETIKETTAAFNDLRVEVTDLNSQLRQMNEQAFQMRQDLETATSEREILSIQLKDLTTKLDLESEASIKWQSDLLQTQIHGNALSKQIDDLKSALDNERQSSSELVLRLARSEAANTKMSNEKSDFQSQLEVQRQNYEKLSAELNLLKTERAALSTEADALRNQLAGELKTSAELGKELRAAKDNLSSNEMSLEKAQRALQNCQRRIDELKTSAAEKEKETSILVASLTKQLEFLKSHLLETWFLSHFETFKRWSKTVVEWVKDVVPRKRVLGGGDGEANCSV